MTDAQKVYEKIGSINAQTNKHLKIVARQYDIKPFSYYSARHTFAHNFRKTTNDLILQVMFYLFIESYESHSF